jgi:hypothetical protein
LHAVVPWFLRLEDGLRNCETLSGTHTPYGSARYSRKYKAAGSHDLWCLQSQSIDPKPLCVSLSLRPYPQWLRWVMPSPGKCRLEVLSHTLCSVYVDHIAHTWVDVSTSELNQFGFWVQYAAATYYIENYDAQVGDKISCSKGNCPEVEQTGATVFYDFSK